MKSLIFSALALLLMSSCNQNMDNATPADIELSEAIINNNLVKLKVSLVDAPNDEIQKVFVNVDHVEMLTTLGGRNDRLVFGHDVGMIDLLTLRNGVSLPVSELVLPPETEIKQIRLVLKEEDNHIIKHDGSRCDLQTPSQQQSGLKILVKDISLNAGYDYDMVIDFDALKSVVLQRNGGCLLKPVLKLQSLKRKEVEPKDPANPGEPEEMIPGEDGPKPIPAPMPGEEPAPAPMPGEEPAPAPMPGEEPAPAPMPGEEPAPAPMPGEEPIGEGDPNFKYDWELEEEMMKT
jgi:hypothetical protein